MDSHDCPRHLDMWALGCMRLGYARYLDSHDCLRYLDMPDTWICETLRHRAF